MRSGCANGRGEDDEETETMHRYIHVMADRNEVGLRDFTKQEKVKEMCY